MQVIDISPIFLFHDDVIKWKHFPRYWPFERGSHRGEFPSQSQWCEALMFSLICVWTHGWANNRDAGDLRRYRHDRTNYDFTVMFFLNNQSCCTLPRFSLVLAHTVHKICRTTKEALHLETCTPHLITLACHDTSIKVDTYQKNLNQTRWFRSYWTQPGCQQG